MTTTDTCTVDSFHRSGRRVAMIPFGDERGGRTTAQRCGDCGVARDGWHHPGCDLQACPVCGGQMLGCGCLFDEDALDFDAPDDDDRPVEPLGVDGNGLLTERMWLDEQEVIIHRDDVPQTDVTTVNGIRCTTALRTVIDLAPELATARLEAIVADCLERGLFSIEEAWRRLAQPDMAGRRGAEMLRRALPTCP